MVLLLSIANTAWKHGSGNSEICKDLCTNCTAINSTTSCGKCKCRWNAHKYKHKNATSTLNINNKTKICKNLCKTCAENSATPCMDCKCRSKVRSHHKQRFSTPVFVISTK
ncbi:unnamed protein product [Gordionus sp. m RMFG-2023]